MGKSKERNITTRAILRSIFSRGNLPRQEDFEKLIDSTFNKADDRMDITDDDGLKLYPTGKNDDVISFFKDRDDPNKGKWAIRVSEVDGFSFKETNEDTGKTDAHTPALQLKPGGNVGIGIANPKEALHVNGLIQSQGRVGSYYEGRREADGQWHNVFEEHRDGINGYEILAYAEGDELKGRFALLHAIALSTFGNSRPQINKTMACYGRKWNRLDLKWESRKTFMENPAKWKFWMRWIPYYKRSTRGLTYNLQIRTRSHFGKGAHIYFRISKIWDDKFIPNDKFKAGQE